MIVSARETVMPKQSPLTIDQRSAHLWALLRGTALASQLHMLKQSSRPPPSCASIVHIHSLWSGPRVRLACIKHRHSCLTHEGLGIAEGKMILLLDCANVTVFHVFLLLKPNPYSNDLNSAVVYLSNHYILPK